AMPESAWREGDTRNDYVSHFDSTNKICYIMTWHASNSVTTFSIHSMVWDAYERRSYAEFLTQFSSGQADYSVKPLTCNLRPRHHKQILCKDRDEYTELVEKWFGIAAE